MLVGLVAANLASAQTSVCTPPGPPPAPLELTASVKPILPSPPACVARNRCGEKDVRAHNGAIERYNAELFAFQAQHAKKVEEHDKYQAALNAFASSTTAYLNCENRRVVELLNAGI